MGVRGPGPATSRDSAAAVLPGRPTTATARRRSSNGRHTRLAYDRPHDFQLIPSDEVGFLVQNPIYPVGAGQLVEVALLNGLQFVTLKPAD